MVLEKTFHFLLTINRKEGYNHFSILNDANNRHDGK